MFVAGASLAPTAAMAQQYRGSLADQFACTPDVYRLCGQYIPDQDDIVACLVRNKAQLSSGCGEVFSRPASAPAAPDTSGKDSNSDEE